MTIFITNPVENPRARKHLVCFLDRSSSVGRSASGLSRHGGAGGRARGALPALDAVCVDGTVRVL
eukprot:4250939-Pleurochrysis_carterae.AAC.3